MDPEASEVPSFIVGGTPKAGTSSLFDWLSSHPQVAPSRQKEINYFDRNFHEGWEWYTAFWPKNAPREALKFEATPGYLYCVTCPKRMHAFSPALKLIFVLRDPASRAHSDWKMWFRQGITSQPFSDMVDECLALLSLDWVVTGKVYSNLLVQNCQKAGLIKCQENIVAKGLYAEQVSRYLQYYARTQLFLIRSETMFAEPAETLKALQWFLGLSEFDFGQLRAVNTADNPTNNVVRQNVEDPEESVALQKLRVFYKQAPVVDYDI